MKPLPHPRVLPRVVATDHRRQPSLRPDAVAEGVRRLGWLGLIYSIASTVGAIAKFGVYEVEGTVDVSGFDVPRVFGLAAVIMRPRRVCSGAAGRPVVEAPA